MSLHNYFKLYEYSKIIQLSSNSKKYIISYRITDKYSVYVPGGKYREEKSRVTDIYHTNM